MYRRWSTPEDAVAATAILNPDLEPDALLWRYMDLAKFLSLLESSGIYFPRADQFEDPNEGAPTVRGIKEQESLLAGFSEDTLLPPSWVQGPVTNARIAKLFAFVSCWHHGEESQAMWRLYGKPDNSVAIVTTAHNLAKIVMRVTKNYFFSTVSPVHYIDHWREEYKATASASAVAPFLHKDLAYSFESEVRAVLCTENWFHLHPDVTPAAEGVLVPVDLAEFVMRIVLPPGAPAFLCSAVRHLVRDRFGIEVPVMLSRLDRQSTLDYDPNETSP